MNIPIINKIAPISCHSNITNPEMNPIIAEMIPTLPDRNIIKISTTNGIKTRAAQIMNLYNEQTQLYPSGQGCSIT